MRFSASRLKAWGNCSLAAHYRYDQNLPRLQNAKASFGTIMHRCLQHYNDTNDYDGAVAMFKDLWANPNKAGVEPDYWPKMTSYKSLREKGLEMLHATAETHRWSHRTVIGTEIPFLVPFGDHELTGFIDLLEIEKSGTGAELLKVVDYKSSSKSPSLAELALDVQMTTYLYSVAQREFWVGVEGNADFNGVDNGEWLWETVGKSITSRAIWFNIWNGKQIDAGPRNEVDYGRLYRVCEEIVRAIEHQVFVPKIGDACTWCDYQQPCALEIPIALSGLDDTADPNRWI